MKKKVIKKQVMAESARLHLGLANLVSTFGSTELRGKSSSSLSEQINICSFLGLIGKLHKMAWKAGHCHRGHVSIKLTFNAALSATLELHKLF